MTDFDYATFYAKLSVKAAEKLAASAAAFASDPTGDAAARLKMDIEYWKDYQSASRTLFAHKL